MNFSEKLIDAKMHGETVPLKGHTKIILADELTGKITDVIESDNMVTDAVHDVLNQNFGGFSTFSNLMPLKNLFNGVLLFQERITESASNYLIPSELDNPMIGNAGPTPHATGSIYRGNPNGGESTETTNSVKFVWDWATNQANGRINCVALCPGVMGDIGLKPVDDTQSPYKQTAKLFQTGGPFTEDWAIRAPFNYVYDQYHYSIYIDGSTFKLKKVEHDYTKFGVLRNSESFRVVNERTATIRAPGSNYFVCEGEKNGVHYFYVIHATSATTLMVDRIKANLSDTSEALVVDTLDVTCSDTTFYTGSVYSRNGSNGIFAVDGDYLYFPNNSKTQFYKVNLYNNADVSLLPGEVLIEYGHGEEQYRYGQQFSNPIRISNGLIFGSTYIINGDHTYPLKRTSAIGVTSDIYLAYQSWVYFARKADAPAAAYAISKQTYSTDAGNGQCNLFLPAYLSTINNLEDEIVKSPSKTMKVEYSLVEA